MPDQPMTALATDNVAGIGRTVYRYKYKDGYGCCCHYERVYVRGGDGMKIKFRFKQKMLTLCCIPMVLLTVISLVLGLAQFKDGMYKETKSSLYSSAIAALNLYQSQGYGDYNERQVTRYRLAPDVVDLIAFCTKNPAPMLPYMNVLKPYGQYWFVTITPYGRDIEPNVPDKEKVMDDFKKLSDIVGVDSMGWRYDPIFID